VTAASPDGDWLQVRVPARPNNTDGWVEAADVRVQAVRHHITVDLGDRELALFEDGVEVLTATVAIGTPENPTPTGTFFLTDKLATDPDGAYGPYALGVSAWSETLSEFAGGDGQIGLHGTDRPELLGQEVSHGCLRVANNVIEALAAELPLGVPVDIRA
jgi:lipoprotein-anchoring transpeptidase ErfK/SrfK